MLDVGEARLNRVEDTRRREDTDDLGGGACWATVESHDAWRTRKIAYDEY